MRQLASAAVIVSGTRLSTLLPAPRGTGSKGHVDYVIANTGAVIVYVSATATETPTATAIPVGETANVGPFCVPGPQPYLVFGAGGSALVTPHLHGVA